MLLPVIPWLGSQLLDHSKMTLRHLLCLVKNGPAEATSRELEGLCIKGCSSRAILAGTPADVAQTIDPVMRATPSQSFSGASRRTFRVVGKIPVKLFRLLAYAGPYHPLRQNVAKEHH